ncbi:hypothetical protein [Kineococcus rhizosphaerae]|uniref:Uncharacterized protein n=1 Tax=Kineococcus rhizosphaerae TaxID=559628 RepID=A0A2T0QTL9_9ACTN|nr:hypothetical protein [Kineococcus rhizosphaerae]PRY08409.1 hypothetical protein CLV37_1244 [Kineococcus rhizosphaerae]
MSNRDKDRGGSIRVSAAPTVRIKGVRDPNVREAIDEMTQRAQDRIKARRALRLGGASTPTGTLRIEKKTIS